MLRDDGTFPMSYGTPLSEIDAMTVSDPTNEPRQYANDDFDDVFGSAPSSPNLSPSEFPTDIPLRHRGNLEYSDVPRIQEKHETEGYRDGVTQGKGQTVQAGFDEGYSLGAVLGLKIGKVLGLLEGVHGALKFAHGDAWADETARVGQLYLEAMAELSTQSVFGSQWWNGDGIWKFEVPGDEEGKEVVFPDVAAAHPLIQKWEAIVQAEVETWKLNLQIMDGNEEKEAAAFDGNPKAGSLRTAENTTSKPPSSSGTSEDNPAPAPPAAKILGFVKADLNW